MFQLLEWFSIILIFYEWKTIGAVCIDTFNEYLSTCKIVTLIIWPENNKFGIVQG